MGEGERASGGLSRANHGVGGGWVQKAPRDHHGISGRFLTDSVPIPVRRCARYEQYKAQRRTAEGSMVVPNVMLLSASALYRDQRK